MTIFDLATRYDRYNGTGTELDPFELTTTWIIANDSGRVSCKIVHDTIENHIYVEDLSVTYGSNLSGYAQQLFEGVLNYLDIHYPGIPIVLNDASIIGIDTPLWIAILLRRGEFSYADARRLRSSILDSDSYLVTSTLRFTLITIPNYTLGILRELRV